MEWMRCSRRERPFAPAETREIDELLDLEHRKPSVGSRCSPMREVKRSRAGPRQFSLEWASPVLERS